MPPAADVAGRQPTPPNLSTPPTPSPPDAAAEKPAAGEKPPPANSTMTPNLRP
jgi:hypothetical protein